MGASKIKKQKKLTTPCFDCRRRHTQTISNGRALLLQPRRLRPCLTLLFLFNWRLNRLEGLCSPFRCLFLRKLVVISENRGVYSLDLVTLFSLYVTITEHQMKSLKKQTSIGIDKLIVLRDE